ncbi:cytosine permease [Chloroflexota bacterium]
MIYQPQQYYSYYPAEYQPQFWQAMIAGIIDLVIVIALGAWAFSLVKKALKGEEVELP